MSHLLQVGTLFLMCDMSPWRACSFYGSRTVSIIYQDGHVFRSSVELPTARCRRHSSSTSGDFVQVLKNVRPSRMKTLKIWGCSQPRMNAPDALPSCAPAVHTKLRVRNGVHRPW